MGARTGDRAIEILLKCTGFVPTRESPRAVAPVRLGTRRIAANLARPARTVRLSGLMGGSNGGYIQLAI